MRLALALIAATFLAAPTILAANDQKTQISVAELAKALNSPNRVFGPAVDPNALHGRVILLWDISEYVDPVAKAIENDTDLDEKDEEGPFAKLDAATKAIRKAAKSAIKDGRLLVIALDPQPADPELRRERTDAIRELKPYFPVYSIEVPTQYFAADGKPRGIISNVIDLAEGDRLTSILAETPEYVPGRIITFRTESHEPVSRRLVAGKKIEPLLAQLRREASGQGDKAAEAGRMVAAVEAWVADQQAAIDADLQNAPSRAAEEIALLLATVPSAGAKYAGALGALRRNPAIKQLSSVRAFLAAANAGKVGRGDLGRNADSFIKRIQPLTESKNASIAADAAALSEALKAFSSETLAKEQAALRASIRERRKAERAKEEARREAKRAYKRIGRNADDDEDKPSVKRETAGSVLAGLAGETAIQPLRAELNRLDDATCNYENLANAYAKHAQAAGERGTAAKALIEAITAARQTRLSELARILKEGKPLDLYIQPGWEKTLTVNYPSLSRTTEGRAALRMLRDSELRAIHGIYDDILHGDPGREEDETNEEYAVAKTQYLQTKYKALRKYRATRSAFGRQAVAQLDAMGFGDSAIESKLAELANTLKEQKNAAKEAEESREEARKKARRNRND